MTVKMDFVECKDIFDSDCWWCGEPSTDVRKSSGDRINNSVKEYSMDNLVAACTPCNQMRRDLSVGTFLGHLRRIVLAQSYDYVKLPDGLPAEFEDEISQPSNEELQRYRNHYIAIQDVTNIKLMNLKYREKKSQAKTEQLQWDVNFEDFHLCKQQKCSYCHRTPQEVTISLDRYDSDGHYHLPNIAPSCYVCNCMIGRENWLDFLQHSKKILDKHGFQCSGEKIGGPILTLDHIKAEHDGETIVIDLASLL
jgi:hypothetical protein